MSSATPAEDPSARRKRPARKYTSRACEECRRRRAKCDGNRPSCSRCLDRGIRCQYSTAEDGRQPAPKAYVVMLRNRIELLERVLHSHGIDPEASVAQLMAEDEISNQHQSTEPEWASAGSNCNVEDLCGTFDGALTLDESLNFDQDGEVRYFGPTSGRLLFRSSANDSPVEEAYSTDPSCTGCSSNTPECPEPAATCRYEVAGELSPPDETWLSDELQAHLIDLYFEWEQPWFQMLNETIFRESMATGGRYFSPLLLTCILAVGSRYCDRLDVRTDPNDPNTAGRMFICKAEKLIQNDLRWPKITTIQSLAIMGMFYIATGSDAAGWLHQGMANRLALDMGLNMDPAVLAGAVSLSPIEIELRRQIYWSLYCHDKLSASYAGRVCTLLDSQGVVNKPYLQCATTTVLPSAKGNGQLRAYSQRDVAKLHQAMIDLCRILEKILHSLWSPRPLLHAHQRSAFFDSCVLELKTWYYDLPSEIKIDRSSGPSKFPHAYTMLMVYHTIFILLCGPFMNKPSSSNANAKTENMTSANRGESQEEKPNPDHSRTTKALASCSSSIRAMCLIIQKYRHTFGSFKMSPITATYCTLSAALIIIENCCTMENKSPTTTKTNANSNYSPDACTAEEATGSNRNLSPHVAVGLCMQVLRELSTSWNIAKRIGRNLEKVYTQRFGSDHVPSPPKECDIAAYEAATQIADANIPFDTNVPPLDTFDAAFDNKNAMHLQNPLSFHLEHQQLPSATEAHSIFLTQNENRPPVTGFDAGVGVGVGVNGPDFSNLVSSDELFAQNLGFAFEPDCLPSDYNMFDTLNQMYLEEAW